MLDSSSFSNKIRKVLHIDISLYTFLIAYVVEGNMPEWLTGWIANPLLFERESSSLSVVDLFFWRTQRGFQQYKLR